MNIISDIFRHLAARINDRESALAARFLGVTMAGLAVLSAALMAAALN